ncbi:MAG: FKBP-type peptidyl-prolyl cis-trans isomerase N-terminal domain-containing protein [Akkermansia sp.]|nr:FKBP-type peptidyl-prolyl cis-trans isomerase N-terminal domain-containing protein [Akkermansia sp.]
MKNTTRTILSLGMVALAPLTFAQDAPAPAPAPAPAAAPAATPSPEEVKQVFSYLLGQQFGSQMAMDVNTLRADDFDQATFFKGVADGLANKVDPEMRQKDVAACMQAFMLELQKRAADAAAANLAAGKAYMEENGKKEGVVTTKSGLQYKVLSAGNGRTFDAKKDGSAAIASITYEGRLVDGTVFDSSATPVDMPINGVIPGFAEALKLMPIGSEWEVVIPAQLGYGEQGPGIIGNNATLIFKLKLVDIKPGRGTQGNPIELTPEMLQQLQESGMQPIN